MLTFSDILLRNKRVTVIVLSSVGLAGIVLLIAGIIGYWHSSQQSADLHKLNARMANLPPAGDRHAVISELEQISAEAKTLGHPLPEVDYARLWHQWQDAVKNFKHIASALNNRFLAAEQGRQLQTFHQQLLALRDQCAAALESREKRPVSLDWKLHTLKGNVSVMLAYSVLNFEQDGRKGAKFLSDAVDDYKTAIDLVDATCSSSLERALPRWNMELITGLGEYSKIGLSEVRQENLTEVQEQLEAFIPDVAGFAPGVPLETRVEK
jgi:hypothetical protein